MTTSWKRLGAFLTVVFIIETLCFLFIDRPVSLYFRSLDATHPAIIDFFRAYTDLGKSVWYLWPSGLGVVICAIRLRLGKLSAFAASQLNKTGHKLLYFFVCIALSGIVADILKILIGRARPVELQRNELYGFHPLSFSAHWHSMPSGHSTTAATLALILSGWAPRYRMLWVIAALMLVFSRIAVNAHFVGDVLAGCLVAFMTVRSMTLSGQRYGINHILERIFPIDKKSTDL